MKTLKRMERKVWEKKKKDGWGSVGQEAARFRELQEVGVTWCWAVRLI